MGERRWVAVHDGARPCVSGDVLERALAEVRGTGAAIAAVPVKDTIKVVGEERVISDTPDRATLWAAQTPQVFDYQILLDAHRAAGVEYTDDAAMVEAAGHRVTVFWGDYHNLKVTTPEDLDMVSLLLARPAVEYRVGNGADAHALAAGRALVLGGVTVPHPAGLAGHSDGDALSHAVIDALLGAAGCGDIGTHFPPEDPSLAGISSLLLLERTVGVLAEGGWCIANVDATMLAQRPRLSPHVPLMRRNIATALSVEQSQVSVKATTTDYLGFTGREEGIAAVAVALLYRP
ncbi:Bifunctional enzyme IspD/IspF [Geodia barretti]|nr:Bifunctional enzyme IspD/IspF [Geodia barretti]